MSVHWFHHQLHRTNTQRKQRAPTYVQSTKACRPWTPSYAKPLVATQQQVAALARSINEAPSSPRTTAPRIQLDWPWIAGWAYAGIFAVAVRIQNQDQFWISHQKIRGHFFLFFQKVENEFVWPKWCFFAILAKIQSFSDISDIWANSQCTSV